jgi:hypothetical protein
MWIPNLSPLLLACLAPYFHEGTFALLGSLPPVEPYKRFVQGNANKGPAVWTSWPYPYLIDGSRIFQAVEHFSPANVEVLSLAAGDLGSKRYILPVNLWSLQSNKQALIEPFALAFWLVFFNAAAKCQVCPKFDSKDLGNAVG